MSTGGIIKNMTEIKELVGRGRYIKAAELADGIQWNRVKDIKYLNLAADIYEKCRRYEDAKKVLLIVYNRNINSKRLMYKLSELSALSGDIEDAEDFYWEYKRVAPKDAEKLILAYYIMCARKEPDKKKIEVLELYVQKDFDEKWAYTLAGLYEAAGQTEKCIKLCDEIILWYSGTDYGRKALRLKHKCQGIEEDPEEIAEAIENESEEEPEEIAEAIENESEEEPEEIAEAVENESGTEYEEEIQIEEKDRHNKTQLILETGSEQVGTDETEYDVVAEDIVITEPETGNTEPEALDIKTPVSVYTEAEEAEPENTESESETYQESNREGQDKEDDIALKEAAVTTEAFVSGNEVHAEPKVKVIGYLNENNKFTSLRDAERETEEDNIQDVEEKTSKKLRIYLVECSQTKSRIQYTVNKLRRLHRNNGIKMYGVAKISGVKLNDRGIRNSVSILGGRDLIIDGTEEISYETIAEFTDVWESVSKNMMIAIADTPAKLKLFVNRYRSFSEKCEYIYEDTAITRDEFIQHINEYAYRLNAILDYTADDKIEDIADGFEEDGMAFTVSDASVLVEDAIEKARKPGIRGLFEAKKDADGLLILRARHFDRG